MQSNRKRKRDNNDECYEINIKDFLQKLQSPIGITSSPHAPDELYIVEQRGIIWKYNIETHRCLKFLDQTKYIVKLDSEYDERGLLSMALHPEFGKKGSKKSETFYIFYSIEERFYKVPEAVALDPIEKYKKKDVYYNCLSAFTKFKSDGTVDIKSEIILLSVQKKNHIHNGGKIIFGPDKYLYIGIGDGG